MGGGAGVRVRGAGRGGGVQLGGAIMYRTV